MRVIYGKDATRLDVTPAVTDVSWSSSRGQIAQVCQIQLRNPPVLAAAGYLMMFPNEAKESEQLFHGPLVEWNRDEKTKEMSGTAYELSWYLQKNDCSRPYLKGDAGKELERIIQGAGISFQCPAFGFTVKERLPSQPYTSLFTDIAERAFERTGLRYFIQHQRDKLIVLAEGNNPYVPVFQATMLEASSTGESLEEVYTAVTVERYEGDRVAGRVTREHHDLMKKIGRMQKIIDAGEEKNLASLASKQLATLAKIPRTRSITVRHTNSLIARLRAGWLVKIQEINGQQSSWIVTSCNTRWKNREFVMDLQLEWRG